MPDAHRAYANRGSTVSLIVVGVIHLMPLSAMLGLARLNAMVELMLQKAPRLHYSWFGFPQRLPRKYFKYHGAEQPRDSSSDRKRSLAGLSVDDRFRPNSYI